MRVARGRAETLAADRSVTDGLVDHVADAGESGLRVWYPHEHVAFGRRDATAEGYDRAVEAAENLGYPTVERSVGGRAVAFTGDVLAFVLAEPADASDPAIQARYDRTTEALLDALGDCGASVQRGEPPDSFCPGTHSLQTDVDGTDGRAGGKVAGLAQRVRREVAVVAGAVVVRDSAAVADLLEPIYGALGVSFDPDSVGRVLATTDESVGNATVREAVEASVLGERS